MAARKGSDADVDTVDELDDEATSSADPVDRDEGLDDGFDDELDPELNDETDDDLEEFDDEADDDLDRVAAEEDADEDDDGRTPVAAALPPDVEFDDDGDDLVAVVARSDADEDEIDGLRAGEFVCRSCYLAKRETQLADPKRLLCRDCA